MPMNSSSVAPAIENSAASTARRRMAAAIAIAPSALANWSGREDSSRVAARAARGLRPHAGQARVKAGRLVVDEPTESARRNGGRTVATRSRGLARRGRPSRAPSGSQGSDEDVKAGLVDAEVVLRELRPR